MGYGSEAVIAAEILAAEEASAAAAAAAATEGAGAAAMYGAGAGASAYGAGAYGAGAAAGTGAALTADEIAAAQIAQEMGASSAGLLGDGGIGAGQAAMEAGASDPSLISDFDRFKAFGKEGFRALGKGMNKMPPGAVGMMSKGLLGDGGQGPMTNITPPRPQGAPAQQGSLVTQQPMPQVTPYAPSLGGNDAEEMKRRLWLMMQGRM